MARRKDKDQQQIQTEQLVEQTNQPAMGLGGAIAGFATLFLTGGNWVAALIACVAGYALIRWMVLSKYR